MSAQTPERIIDLHELKKLVAYSRQHIRRLEQAGEFPKRVKIGTRRVGWMLSEVQEWIEGKAGRTSARSNGQTGFSQSDNHRERRHHQSIRNHKGGAARFGYQWHNGQLIPHPEEATILRLTYELFREHKRKKTVARILNERGHRTRRGAQFTDTTIARFLRDADADGPYKDDDQIISIELREDCSIILDEQKRTGRMARTVVHLFSGLAFCECGTKMYVPSKTSKYVCTNCRNKIPTDDLEALFREQLKALPSLNDDDTEPHDFYTVWNKLHFAEKRTVVELVVETMLIGENTIELN